MIAAYRRHAGAHGADADNARPGPAVALLVKNQPSYLGRRVDRIGGHC
jgi:hypothetical protein